MKAAYRKTAAGLLPCCDEGEKIWKKLELGQLCMVELTRGRNYDNHTRFFRLRNETFDIQDEFVCEELWRKQLLIMAGHFEMVIVPKPEWWEWMNKYLLKYLKGPHIQKVIDQLDEALGVQLQAKSMAFDQMDEIAFRKMFSSAVTGFINRYSPEMDENQFMQILEYDL